MSTTSYSTLAVTKVGKHVVHVELNRPEKLNTYSIDMWREIRECFHAIALEPSCRAVVLSGAGRLFTAGLDISAMSEFTADDDDEEADVARAALRIRQTGKAWQGSFNAIEKVCGTMTSKLCLNPPSRQCSVSL
jgi:Delta3,5-Delta2,4-dienoyl-CoA isomerase